MVKGEKGTCPDLLNTLRDFFLLAKKEITASSPVEIIVLGAVTLSTETMLWILILGLTSGAQGEIHCSGQKLTLETSCGETVTLPCQFSWVGPQSPSKYELVWQLKKNKNDFVVHDEDIMSPANLQQSSRFTNRTSVQDGWDQHGNATLQIKDITESDQGVYTCDLLTPRPFDRKICMTITLLVNSYSNNCGKDQSLNASSGQSIQLPCLLRPGCLPRTKRGITWRFTTYDGRGEVALPSSFRVGEQGRKFVLSSNGTLILQELAATDSGTYCCYLQDTERCLEVHLRVYDVVVVETDPEMTPIRLILFVLLPLTFIAILITFFVAFWNCNPQQHHMIGCECLLCERDLRYTKRRASSKAKQKAKATDSKGDGFKDYKIQDSITSSSGLLPAKSKSGGCNAVPV